MENGITEDMKNETIINVYIDNINKKDVVRWTFSLLLKNSCSKK